MTQPGRTLVTFACDEAMHRDLQTAATATNRSVAEEIETRLMALRLIEESMRILKTVRSHGEAGINGAQSKV
jgi:hypothetical protein